MQQYPEFATANMWAAVVRFYQPFHSLSLAVGVSETVLAKFCILDAFFLILFEICLKSN